jgi:hypothetical protein
VGQDCLGPSYFFISLVCVFLCFMSNRHWFNRVPGAATSARPSKQPRMVGSTLGVYSFGLIFVSATTNRSHHHQYLKYSVTIQICRSGDRVRFGDMSGTLVHKGCVTRIKPVLIRGH